MTTITWPPAPWVGVTIVVTGLLGMLATLRLVRARAGWHAEVMRKLAHIGLGIASLSFAWLFTETWPVLLLGGLAFATLAALRWVPWVRSQVGVVVHGVNRASGGDLYFPIAATGLFVLAEGNRVLYAIPILTLTMADATAALIGITYGRTTYDGADGGPKSIEGSIAFFVVAFLSAHIPLLLFTSTGRAESLLIGLMFGMLLMLLEAISWRGLDNLFIPFGGFLLLRAFLSLDAPALVGRLLVTMLLLGLVLGLRRQKSLDDTAMLVGVLVGYVAWSAGGWTWLVPPIVLFVIYNVIFPKHIDRREHPHSMVAVLTVTATGLAWLALTGVFPQAELYYPYTLNFAATLCFIGITWYGDYRRRAPAAEVIMATSGVGWLALFLPYLFVAGVSSRTLQLAAAALPLLLTGAVLHRSVIPYVKHRPLSEHPWMRQAALSMTVSTLGLAAAWALGAAAGVQP